MKHWLRNLDIAKSIHWATREYYDFEAKSCSYCLEYARSNCKACPLKLVGYQCYLDDSPYYKVTDLFCYESILVQEQLIEAISYMIKCLEEVKDD